jgi:tetratricopeptide (TPR) repeat protein
VLKGKGLKSETFEQMISKQAAIDENCVNCLEQRKNPSISKNMHWGLGWGIQHTNKGPALWHLGDNGNFKAYAIGLLNQKDGVVFFANGSNGLSITEELVNEVLNITQPSVKWLGYEPYNTVTRKLLRSIISNPNKAIQELKASAGHETLNANQYSWIAQRLYNRKMYSEAIELYLLSLEKSPKSLGTLTGIAQTFLKLNNKQAALKYYKMAQPLSQEIAEIVARLEKPEIKVEEKILNRYLGEYDSPLGRLIVSRDGQQLYVELVGQSKEEVSAESETRFYAQGIRAYITFLSDSKGVVTDMVVEAGGQKLTAKKR